MLNLCAVMWLEPQPGFTVQTQDVPVADPTQDGIVQSTNPPAGQTVPQGSTVTMAVGRLGP